MIRKHAKFQKNPIKDVGGVVDTALKIAISQFARALIMSEIIGSKIQYHRYILMYIKKRKSSKLQKYPIKDVGGARTTRCVMDTQTDRMTHRRTRVISIVPPLLHRLTNKKNSYTAFNHLPASILRKSTSGRHRPVSYPDGPMTARYRFT